MRRLLLFAGLLMAACPAHAAPDAPHILAFGDSLTAGYGLDRGLGFAPQLQATLRRHGIRATVSDGGVSGDTSSAGRARLGWTLDGLGSKPDLVIVELGANDMLRNLDPQLAEANIDAILAELKRRDIPVLLAGMRATRNLDPAYVERFEALYLKLARKHGVALYPFFLDGAALVPGRMQADGMHPSFEGIKAVVTRIAPAVIARLRP
ncbi:arylesterase [Sphingomonas sp.]|uniref:arylesterase n=1 Tax=Sphingomonas sp. TaxID=28214 RepID=UPI00286DCF4F|nr:arylesterase [Sphingomonas sp.]